MIGLLLCILVGILLLVWIYQKKEISRILVFLLGYHFLFCAAFIYVSSGPMPSDAIGYFSSASEEWGHKRHFMGKSIVWFTRQLISLGFRDYWQVSFVYAALGFLGIAWTSEILFKYATTRGERRLATLILFFPNIHFWSSGIGKDSLVVFTFGLIVISLTKSRFLPWLFSIILTTVVRPHFGITMAFASIASTLLGRSSSSRKNFILTTTLLLLVGIFTIVGDNLMNIASEQLQFLDERTSVMTLGALGHSFVGFPLIIRIFILTFYPLVIPSNPIIMIVVLENLVCLFMILAIFRTILTRSIEPRILDDRVFIFSLSTFVILSIILGKAIYGVGLLIRQEVILVLSLSIIYFILHANLKIRVFISSGNNKYPANTTAFLQSQGIQLKERPCYDKKSNARNLQQHPVKYITPKWIVNRVTIDMHRKKIRIYIKRR